jgi:hypothetical protein
VDKLKERGRPTEEELATPDATGRSAAETARVGGVSQAKVKITPPPHPHPIPSVAYRATGRAWGRV